MADIDTETAPKGLSSTVLVLSAGLAALLTLGSIAEALDLFRAAGITLLTEQRLMVMLGIALAIAFIAFGARQGAARPAVPVYDWIAALVGLAVCAYVAWRYEWILDNLHDRPKDVVVSAIIIVALVAEGLRRTAGNVLFVFLLVFVAFGLLGHYVPGQFQGQQVDFDRMFVYIALDTNGLVGIPMVVSTTIVITFIYFGFLLEASGGSRFFTDISMSLMGRYRGGASKIAIVASSLFGSVSGSAVSNVVSTGVVTIPLMRKGGYPPHVSGAIEAVASTGGQLMPPIMGAAAFVMAEFLQIPYGTVVIAAIVPSLLYYMTLFVLADLYAGRHGILPIEEALIPKRWPVFRAGWVYLLPFAALIYALFNLNMRADTAALVGAGVAMLVGVVFGYGGQRMPLSAILNTLVTTGHAVVQIVMIGAMAGIVIGVLNITALGFAMTQALVQLGAGNLFALLIIAALVSIVLGMGMPTLGVYLLLATLVIPSLVEVGIQPLAAHMFALYFGMLSMITPPVAIAAFAAATIAESNPMRTGFAAVQFGWAAYAIPFFFVLAPDVLMQNGFTLKVAIATLTAFAGIWFASTGIIGYMLQPMGWPMRLIAVVSGFLLFIPTSRLPYSGWTDVIGLILAVPVIVSQFSGWRSHKQTDAALGR